MARKGKSEEVKKGLDEWMATYGDMVTLLLCFFVLLFAMSNIDADKFKAMAASFSKDSVSVLSDTSVGMMEALGNGIIEMPQVQGDSTEEYEEFQQGVAELEALASDFKTYFAEHNMSEKVIVTKDKDKVNLSFEDGILFDLGKSDLKTSSLEVLSYVANEIINHPNNKIKIEGHTDNLPINTSKYPSNWYLSAARSISVAEYFIDKKGISPERITAEGCGEYKPKRPNDTPENRAINRRVEIKIFRSDYEAGFSEEL